MKIKLTKQNECMSGYVGDVYPIGTIMNFFSDEGDYIIAETPDENGCIPLFDGEYEIVNE